MADARIIKFDVDSPTDQALKRMQKRLHASTSVEAMRRSLAIADTITGFIDSKQQLYVKDKNGTLREIVIS